MDKIRFKRVIEGKIVEFCMSRDEYRNYMISALINFREKNNSEQVEADLGVDKRYQRFKKELENLLDE